MKSLLFFIFLMFGITACSAGRYNCSAAEEVCVELRAEEPVQPNEPLTLTITATTTTDIPELQMYLTSIPRILIEDGGVWKEWVNWVINAEADHTYVFTYNIRFTYEDAIYQLYAGAYTPSLGDTSDSIHIQLNSLGGTVYYAGTPIPTSSGPLPTTDPITLATLHAMPSPTPWPILTPYPTNTVAITSTPYPPPDMPPPDVPYP